MSTKRTAEAVIVGGGVMGCSILYNLAVRGMTDTLLLERDVLGSGSTGRSQAICRTHYSNPVTAIMAWESLKILRDFPDQVGGPSGFVTTGYYAVAGEQDGEAMRANVAMLQSLGINTNLVSHEDVALQAPMLDMSGAMAIAHEPETGYADTYAVTSTYARRAREMGAQVRMQTPATSIEVKSGRVVVVTTPQGSISTPTVVVAAGPWASELLLPLGVDIGLKTVRHQIIQIQRPVDVLPDHPTVADLVLELSFRPEGQQLTLVGFGEEEVQADSYNQGFDLEPAGQAFARAASRMPALAEGYLKGGWSGLFTITPDWHPVLDRVEGIEGLYCAVGFSGHGFNMSPMEGAVIAELMLEGRATSVDIRPLRLSRFREGDLVRSRYHYAVLA